MVAWAPQLRHRATGPEKPEVARLCFFLNFGDEHKRRHLAWFDSILTNGAAFSGSGGPGAWRPAEMNGSELCWQIFGKISLVFGCIGADLCK